MGTILIVALIIGGIGYFTPTIVACCRDVRGKFGIFILNAFFGWSLIGYWMAFIFACGPSKAQLRWQAERERLAIAADETIVEMGNHARLAIRRRMP
jgi:hypothetical protein